MNEEDKIQDYLDEDYDREQNDKCEDDNIEVEQYHKLHREDVICSACGNTGNWTHKDEGFLVCECGNEQEDN